MANVNDLFYHGIRQQVRRVLNLLGDERIDKGMNAFEDGASNWSRCFFAQALAPEYLNDETDVARILGLKNSSGGWNLVPVRLVYQTFDGNSTLISKAELVTLINSIRDESRPDEVMNFLRSIQYDEKREAQMEPSCA